MAKVFGLENGPEDVYLDHISEVDSDEEHRDADIKNFLDEELGNETFHDSDSGDDTSYRNGSNFSNHNNCSFVSNKDGSINGRGSGAQSGQGDFMTEQQEQQKGIFQTPKLNESGTVKKRINFSTMQNSIPLQNDDSDGSSKGTNGFVRGLNGHGNHLNGNGIDTTSRLAKYPKPTEKNNNHVTDLYQKNFEMDEIVVPNPTISLLHKEHCPQSYNDGLSDGIWPSADSNNVEKLKAMCELRERQVHRIEESLAANQKEKRALNHQIGLMKAEMVQMKSQCDEAEKFAEMKDEEVVYLKTKIQEAIEEYQKARRNEELAHNHSQRIQLENDKLRQEVQMLSSLGTSTQQAELNDVVRQHQEKHAQDHASWRKVVAKLEGEISTYKRAQHLFVDDSHTIIKASVQTQTEYQPEEELEQRERELAAQEFQEEFGDLGEDFLNQLKDLPEPVIIKRVREEWKTAKNKLVVHFLTEIKRYKQLLTSLPGELYNAWEQRQKELGLSQPFTIKPLLRQAATMTEETYTRPPQYEKATSLKTSRIEAVQNLPESADAATDARSPEMKEEAIQVNFAAVLASTHPDAVDFHTQTKTSPSNSGFGEEKETSSVLVQTDETLDTYKTLAALIDSWSREVTVCKQRADFAESKSSAAEEELKTLNGKFIQLQKATKLCRKQWKKQEENLRSTNAKMKAHYMEVMHHLDDKLAIVDQIELEN